VKSPGNPLFGAVILVPILVLCALFVAPAPSAGQGSSAAGAAVHTVTAITMPEGVVQIALPAVWESNTRLAEENGAPGFLHPSGTPVGQDLPFWVVVDRCPRNIVERFPALVKRVLEEGKPYGFTLQDSVAFRTSDNRRVVECSFAPSKEGAKRGLGLVEIPTGALLFRYQAQNDKTWEQFRPKVEEIIRGARFLPMTKK
jgi:hypothetical protein